ncbi:MAG: hypothetical protein Q8K58_11230 [Acidimicrobiales bacterium]|nr:hypothetical protein [Acidimicrobiales bacterium]
MSKSLLRRKVRHRVVVSLKSGDSFQGVLSGVYAEAMELRCAQLIDGRGELMPVDGHLLVLRADVAYIQIPEPTN